MNLSNLFDPINNNRLFGYDDNFNLFKDLILKEKLPKVILLSGEKGTGKSSFVNHFLHYYFDKEHYDEKNKVVFIISTKIICFPIHFIYVELM